MTTASPARMVARTRTSVGEGPIWVAREGAVYWVDLLGDRLHRLVLATGTLSEWPFPEMICWIVETTEDGVFVVGTRTSIQRLTLDPFSLERVLVPEPDLPGNRLNDAKTGPDGRLWFGTMHATAESDTGSLYALAPGMELTRVDTGYLVSNGPALGAEGDVLYHADSLRRTIYRFEVTLGGLASRSDFAVFDEDEGLPDGMTVDADGCLWVAHWDGGCVSRFDTRGRLLERVALPVSRPTSCAFGGPAMTSLLVTTAAHECDDEPLAGALFVIDTTTRGIVPTRFALS